MKKWLLKLLALALACTAAFAVTACDKDSETPQDPPPAEEPGGEEEGGEEEETSSEIDSSKTLNEWMKDVDGRSEWTVNGTVKVQITSGANKQLGAETVEEIVLVGKNTVSTLQSFGTNGGEIRANGNGKLVFKNLKFEDNVENYNSGFGVKKNCIELGGKLRFENCTINTSLFLSRDTDAEFVNCTFTANEHEKIYGIWVCDGNTKFTNCTFTGYRAVKLYEDDSTYDIESVSFDGCTFSYITEKPALCIGEIVCDAPNTIVSMKNCTIIGCQDWDANAEGIDGFYEADSLSASDDNLNGFVFTVENTTVDGVEVDLSQREYKN